MLHCMLDAMQRTRVSFGIPKEPIIFSLVVILLAAFVLAARIWRSRSVRKEVAAAAEGSPQLADLTLASYFTPLYRRLHQVLGLAHGPLDPEQVKQQFIKLFQAHKSEQNADTKLQIMCSAFLLLMNRVQINSRLTLNQSATNIKLQVQVDNERSKLDAASLERRAAHAEGLFAALQGKLMESGHRVERLSKLVLDWGEQLSVLQMRARCAPPYFDALACFLQRSCVENEDHRVGCAELHAATLNTLASETCELCWRLLVTSTGKCTSGQRTLMGSGA